MTIYDLTSTCQYMIIILPMTRSGAAEPFPLRLEMPKKWGDWTIEHPKYTTLHLRQTGFLG